MVWMIDDELNAPLGRRIEAPRACAGSAGSRARGIAATALCGVLAALSLALYLQPPAPFGGAPHALAPIMPAPPAPSRPIAASEETAARDAPDDETAERRDAAVIVRRIGEGAGLSGARIIRIARDSGVRLAPAPDPKVSEKGAYGLVPRLGPNGLRPMDVYARPFVTATSIRRDAPKVALVVGGVGLNPGNSKLALDLPAAVTLAFAPYGKDVDALAARARDLGHETLLQAPMEPFGYPQNNPGPHTLLTGADDGGRDDLQWLMSRFSGYAGVMNYLGGRYMADEEALAGTLSEIGQRGLFFLDDAGARQSLVPTLAPKLATPYAVVDVRIDARDTPQAIEGALAQLEARAREKSVAIGFVEAAPAALARIARFARDLEARGLALAPVTAIVGRPETGDAAKKTDAGGK